MPQTAQNEPADSFAKVTTSSAAQACKGATLTEPARALLTPDISVPALLRALMQGELFIDAVVLMAHALPKREAIWWACIAARTQVLESTPPPTVAALEAAEAWVYTPSEEARRAAMERAQATHFDHPGIWAAVGVFWSGGSMVAENLPAVPPGEHLTAIAVAGAVQLSAVMPEPQLAPEKLREFLRQAVDIANGGNGLAKEGGG